MCDHDGEQDIAKVVQRNANFHDWKDDISFKTSSPKIMRL